MIQTIYMTVILQAMERSAQLSGDLTDRGLSLRTSEGEEQEILLAKGGSLYARDGATGDSRQVGRWVQYPECHVLHWDVSLSFGRNTLRGKGLLQRVSGVIIYTERSDGGTRGDLLAQCSFTEHSQPSGETSAPRLKVVGG